MSRSSNGNETENLCSTYTSAKGYQNNPNLFLPRRENLSDNAPMTSRQAIDNSLSVGDKITNKKWIFVFINAIFVKKHQII